MTRPEKTHFLSYNPLHQEEAKEIRDPRLEQEQIAPTGEIGSLILRS